MKAARRFAEQLISTLERMRTTSANFMVYPEKNDEDIRTKREVIIIRMICQGMSSKQIAGNLFLSELTVTTHRRNILRKLEVKNVAGLMNFAKQNQLL